MFARSPLQVAACTALNHLLQQQPGANSKLKSHIGKCLRLRSGPLDFLARIDESGSFFPAEADAVADASLRVAFNSLLHRHDPAGLRTVQMDGDQILATDVGRILQNLEWDFEDDLSRVFGDIPGRLMAERARAFDAWGRRAVTSVAQNFAEYWTYEAPLIAPRAGIEEFVAAVSQARDAVERLEKRIERLMQP